PNITSISTGIFDLNQLSILSRKDPKEKSIFEEVEVFEISIWLSLLGCIILVSLITSLLSKKKKIKFLSLFFSLTSLTLMQSSRVIGRKADSRLMIYCF